MPLDNATFPCPNCGTSVTVRNRGRAQSVVCPQCLSILDLTQGTPALSGRTITRSSPRTAFTIGGTGTLDGIRYSVVGRIRYVDDENYAWDEWVLADDNGGEWWISDDPEQGYVLWQPIDPPNRLDPADLFVGKSIDLGYGPATVSERITAYLNGAEGEIPWVVQPGEVMHALDATSSSVYYSVEWSTSDTEYSRGRLLPKEVVAQAFGVKTPSGLGFSGGAGGKANTVVIAVIGILIALCCSFGGLSSRVNCPPPPPVPTCVGPNCPPPPAVARGCGSSVRVGSPGRPISGGGK